MADSKVREKFSMEEFIEFLSSDSESDSDVAELSYDNISEHCDDNIKEKKDCINDDNNNCGSGDGEQSSSVTEKAEPNLNNAKHKSEAKKRETLTQIQQLRNHIVLLEKEKKSLLQGRTRQPDGRVYVDLIDVELKCNENRKKEKCEIQQNLTRISSKIDKFKRTKDDVRKCPSNVDKLKDLMEDVEDNVMQFKDRQRAISTYLQLGDIKEAGMTSIIKHLSSFIKNSRMRNWLKYV